MNKIITLIRESRVARFLIPAGIMLLVAGIIFMKASIENKDYLKTEATVTKCEIYEEEHTDATGDHQDATYKVDLKYTVNGKEYTGTLEGVSKFDAGDKMTIYYDPADPTAITQSKSMLIPLAMILAGVAALAGGVLSVISVMKRYNRMKKQEEEWANG